METSGIDRWRALGDRMAQLTSELHIQSALDGLFTSITRLVADACRDPSHRFSVAVALMLEDAQALNYDSADSGYSQAMSVYLCSPAPGSSIELKSKYWAEHLLIMIAAASGAADELSMTLKVAGPVLTAEAKAQLATRRREWSGVLWMRRLKDAMPLLHSVTEKLPRLEGKCLVYEGTSVTLHPRQTELAGLILTAQQAQQPSPSVTSSDATRAAVKRLNDRLSASRFSWHVVPVHGRYMFCSKLDERIP